MLNLKIATDNYIVKRLKSRKAQKRAAIVAIVIVIIFLLQDLILSLLWMLPTTPLQKVTFDQSMVSAECDPNITNHVYKPQRFEVIEDCIAITGTVTLVEVMANGEARIFMKLNPQYQNLTNIFNKVFYGGDFIAKITCYRRVDDESIRTTCKNYANLIQAPIQKATIRAIGTLVINKSTGQTELHPLTSIQITSTQ